MFKNLLTGIIVLSLLVLSACAEKTPAVVEVEGDTPAVRQEESEDAPFVDEEAEEAADAAETDAAEEIEEEINGDEDASVIEPESGIEETEEEEQPAEAEEEQGSGSNFRVVVEGDTLTFIIENPELLTDEEREFIAFYDGIVTDFSGTNTGGENEIGWEEPRKPDGDYGYNKNGNPYFVSEEQTRNLIDTFVANYRNTASYASLDEKDLEHLDENLDCIQNRPERSKSVSSLIEAYRLGEIDEEMITYSLELWIEGGGLYGTTIIYSE